MHGDKIAPMINNSVGGANETGKIFQEKRAIVIDSAEVVFTVACHYRRIVYNVGHVLSSWCFAVSVKFTEPGADQFISERDIINGEKSTSAVNLSKCHIEL